MASSGLSAQADNETFPTPGKTYDVIFAENAQQGHGQIKVIRKGEGSWILVEYTVRLVTSLAPPTAPKTITKKLWINTQWIVSASEPEVEAEKK